MQRPSPLLLVLALALAAPAARADANAVDGSLERLLEDVRRRREETAARLAQPVAELLQRLSQAPEDDAEAVQRARDALIALGQDAAPLLVPHVDPGFAPKAPAKLHAERVTLVLEGMPTRATTTELVRLARRGSPDGRANAMRLLGSSPDRAVASACLIDIYRSSKGPTRAAALAAIARVGDAPSQAVLIDALSATDVDVLRAVLLALADQRVADAREQVRSLVTAPSAAAPLVAEILAYYGSIGAAFDAQDAEALVRLASSDAPQRGARLAILDALPRFGSGAGTRIRRSFDALLESSDEELREAAQIALARLGDRGERRELIKKYDELVARNDSWATGYEKRGALLLKLGEHADAAKDYARAIKLYEGMDRPQPVDELYVELARAYALDANPRKAAETLEGAKLPRSILKRLAEDPDFGELKRHPKYGKVLDV